MTPQDLQQISDLLDKKLEQKLDQKFDEKLKPIISDIAVLKFKVDKNEKHIQLIDDSLTAWKSEVFDALDKFMVETKDQRDFRIISSHQTTSNTSRIEKLETKVFGRVVSA